MVVSVLVPGVQSRGTSRATPDTVEERSVPGAGDALSAFDNGFLTLQSCDPVCACTWCVCVRARIHMCTFLLFIMICVVWIEDQYDLILPTYVRDDPI